MADFTHDDPERTLLLTGAYLKGTRSRSRALAQAAARCGSSQRPNRLQRRRFMSSPVMGAQSYYAMELEYLQMSGVGPAQWHMLSLPF